MLADDTVHALLQEIEKDCRVAHNSVFPLSPVFLPLLRPLLLPLPRPVLLPLPRPGLPYCLSQCSAATTRFGRAKVFIAGRLARAELQIRAEPNKIQARHIACWMHGNDQAPVGVRDVTEMFVLHYLHSPSSIESAQAAFVRSHAGHLSSSDPELSVAGDQSGAPKGLASRRLRVHVTKPVDAPVLADSPAKQHSGHSARHTGARTRNTLVLACALSAK